jgi:hypothetical protein
MFDFILKNVGRLMMLIGGIAFLSETPEHGPIIHQVYLWLLAAAAISGGYWIYRFGGGTFRFKDLFSE